MSALGGTVFRANRVSVEDEKDAREQAATKAEIAHLKEEQSTARQEDKAKIQKKIDTLNAKLQSKQQQAEATIRSAKDRGGSKTPRLGREVKEIFRRKQGENRG